jgi:hypothetical protein
MIRMPFITIPGILPKYTVRGPSELLLNNYQEQLDVMKTSQDQELISILVTAIFGETLAGRPIYALKSEVEVWLNENCKWGWRKNIVEHDGNRTDLAFSSPIKADIDFVFRSKQDAAMFKLFWF